MTDEQNSTRVSLHRHSRLTLDQLAEIKDFVTACQANRGFEYRFHWWCLKHRKLSTPYEYLCYLEGNLILYISVYNFNPHELEVCAAMSPTVAGDISELYRQVLFQIQQDWKHYQISRFLLCANQLDFHLIYALHGIGAKFSHRDYQLKLKMIPVEQELVTLTYRPAEAQDLQQIVKMHCECFPQVAESDYKIYLQNHLLDSNRKVFLVYEAEHCIGKLHFRIDEQVMMLHDFCIVPEYQKKGHGSKILKDLLPHMMEIQNPTIIVEVEQDEQTLLEFYRKNHFEVMNVYNYFNFVFPLHVVE